MHDKMKNWSEGHGSYEDMTDGAFTDDEEVASTIVKRGVIPVANCNTCGRQWKGIFLWPEIALYFLRQMQSPIDPNQTKFVSQGVMCKLGCNGCSKPFTILVTWAEVDQWVNAGISSGALKPEIKMARRR